VSRLFTMTDSMDYLRLSKPTLHRLIRAGRLPVVRIGGRVLFRKEDLDDFVTACVCPRIPEGSDVCPQREAVGEQD
jgi:excisionase family DNA binding protein